MILALLLLASLSQAGPNLSPRSINCLGDLLKSDYSPGNSGLSGAFDLSDLPPPPPTGLESIDWGSADAARRVDAARKLPLAELIATPGKSFLSGSLSTNEPIILNFVRENGRVTSADVWSGNDSLVALLREGKTTLGDLPPGKVQILVDGRVPSGEKWDHWVPVHGVDLGVIDSPFRVVPSSEQVEAGTIAVDGSISNHRLGSRTTIGALEKSSSRPRPARVIVGFGTYDPLHHGHLDAMKGLIAQGDFDEALVVPNYTASHKPGATPIATRVALTTEHVRDEDKINVYLGDSSLILRQFGMEAFIRRVQAMYGTTDVTIMVGQDAYEDGLLPYGYINPKMQVRYIVNHREGRKDGIHIPAGVGDRVKYVDMKDRGLSSTYVRKLVAAGKNVPEDVVHPRVYAKIRRGRLYGARTKDSDDVIRRNQVRDASGGGYDFIWADRFGNTYYERLGSPGDVDRAVHQSEGTLDLDSYLEDAARERDSLDPFLRLPALVPEGTSFTSRVKTQESLKDDLITATRNDRKYNLERIPDVIGARYAVPDWESVVPQAKRVREFLARIAGVKLIREDSVPFPGGHRAIKLQYRIRNGIPFEIDVIKAP